MPLAHNYENAPQQLDREQILAQIKPVLENEAVKKSVITLNMMRTFC